MGVMSRKDCSEEAEVESEVTQGVGGVLRDSVSGRDSCKECAGSLHDVDILKAFLHAWETFVFLATAW